MLDSPILGMAIGLVLIFATVALLCSGVTETLSNWLQLRAKYLLTGLRAMLDAPESSSPGPSKLAQPRLNRMVKDVAKTTQASAIVTAIVNPVDPVVVDPNAAPPVVDPNAPEVVDPNAPPVVDPNAAPPVVDPNAAPPVVDPNAPPVVDPNAPPPQTVFTTALFASPQLQSLQSRRIGVLRKGRMRNPQYISGPTFARALVDLLVPAPGSDQAPLQLQFGQITAAIDKLPPDLPLRAQLLSFVSRADGSVSTFEKSLEQWYDEQMGKISGWYKRWSRVVLGLVGFVVALLVNIDTLQVAHALYVDAPVQQAVIATANSGTLCQNDTTASARNDCARSEISQLKVAGLPIGYSSACNFTGGHWARCWTWEATDALHWWNLPLKLLGWLITAFAVSFGAPFWFDALSKLGSLRNTGTKPATATTTAT